jgi:hypothetical protein
MPDLPAPVPQAKPTPGHDDDAKNAAQPPASPSADSDEDQSMDWVVLGGLDKLTARVVRIEAQVGHSVHFGHLEIIPRACRQRSPEAANPESAAFLDIWDAKPGQPAQSVFRGWMFASSPALSAMEHPIYDIWVLTCKAKGN